MIRSAAIACCSRASGSQLSRSLPRAAGIGFAVSMVLLVLANIPDTGPWQAIAGALMTASTAWIAAAAGRRGAPARMAGTDHTIPAESHPDVAHSTPSSAR